MKTSTMKRLGQGACAVAFALAAAGANATLLSELLDGGSITAGDKLFDEWTVLFEDSSDPLFAFDYDNIDVTALNDGGLDPGPGLQFDILNGEFDVTGDGINAYKDFSFGFRVSVLDPGLRIVDTSLEITQGLVTNLGDNGFYILETVGTAPEDNDLGEMTAEFSWLDPSLDGPGLIANLSDSAAFAPQSEIWVTKNILVWATGESESASLQGFQQRFSQTAVPEPATALLVGLGLAGLASRRRKATA